MNPENVQTPPAPFVGIEADPQGPAYPANLTKFSRWLRPGTGHLYCLLTRSDSEAYLLNVDTETADWVALDDLRNWIEAGRLQRDAPHDPIEVLRQQKARLDQKFEIERLNRDIVTRT